jgi:hypothetical protein
MLDSYQSLLGRPLVDRQGSDLVVAERLYRAAFVVVAHGTGPDPVLSYGNAVALALWEMHADAVTRTPSRLTAEPADRAERARLLDRTLRDGFVDDYSGVRISRTGRRFHIERAIIWNLSDATGAHVGQAATFDQWTPLG